MIVRRLLVTAILLAVPATASAGSVPKDTYCVEIAGHSFCMPPIVPGDGI